MKRWLLALGAVIALGGSWYAWRAYWRVEVPILVGILHSKSGPLEISERSMIEAELMAIDEINKQGGLLGREVRPVVADGRSDPQGFAQEARRLIETEKVSVNFGCWTSLCRRSVKSVVEPSNHLLFFPSNLPWQAPRRWPVRDCLEPGKTGATDPLPCSKVPGRLGRICGMTLHEMGYERVQSPDGDRFSRTSARPDQASGTWCTQSGCFQRAKIEILSAIG